MSDRRIKGGWTLTAEENQDRGGMDFFLIKGDQSASLQFAIETGTDSSCDEPIPDETIYHACVVADEIDPSGEWVDQLVYYR